MNTIYLIKAAEGVGFIFLKDITRESRCMIFQITVRDESDFVKHDSLPAIGTKILSIKMNTV